MTQGVFTQSLVKDPENPNDPGVKMNATVARYNTQTKKFASPPTPFRHRSQVYQGFEHLFSRFADSTLVVIVGASAGNGERPELRDAWKRLHPCSE